MTNSNEIICCTSHNKAKDSTEHKNQNTESMNIVLVKPHYNKLADNKLLYTKYWYDSKGLSTLTKIITNAT